MSTFLLKLFALLTMIVDHCAVVAYNNHFFSLDNHFELYLWFRGIGRIAFPIYCFLLSNGLYYTKSREKYLLRLLLYAFISQIPFAAALFSNDLSTSGISVMWNHLNVMFTLFIGAFSAYLLDKIHKKNFTVQTIVLSILIIGLLVCIQQEWIHVDYGIKGIILIVFLSLVPNHKFKVLVLLFWCAFEYLPMNRIQFYLVFIGVIAAMVYNGKQGPKFKWFFYWSYPVHLAVLSLIVWIPALYPFIKG